MDRHYLSEDATAEIVAQLHQEDLKIQDKFGCRGLTYWFDGKRKTAFCLVEAPNKDALIKMHDHAHGDVPNMIIEVNSDIVESFLGRIEDPLKSQNTELNIINDPAFRTIMVIGIKWVSLKNKGSNKFSSFVQSYNKLIVNSIAKFNGRLVQQKSGYVLTSFDSVTNAILCATEIHEEYKKVSDKTHKAEAQLKIGLSAGVPVTQKDQIFEETIKVAEHFCKVADGSIVVSSEVKDLYESENLNISINKKLIHTLNRSDEKFLLALMDFMESEWHSTTLTSDVFSRKLGYSKSQLYRKLISITGKSPNSFIKEYRLDKALNLLNKKVDTISQIAFETGFNSPAYFSKCFQELFGVLPSTYLKEL